MSQPNAKNAVLLASQRGAKRHCENEDCGRPFYDLNRASAECPYCGASAAGNVIERHVFEMAAARQTKRRNYRLVDEPALRPKVDDAVVVGSEDAMNMPPDVLIDVDEDESASDGDVMVEEAADEAGAA